MNANRLLTRLKGKGTVIAAVTLAIPAAALFLTTELTPGVSMAAGASSALAELVARSPGMRMGGVALKGKMRRAAAPVAKAAPDNAVASVLGAAAGPESAIPVIGQLGTGDFPGDFVAPYVPAMEVASSTPAFGPGLPNLPGPGGVPIFGGPVGGGGGSGGGTGGTGGGTGIVPPPPPVIPGVPEPSVWFMLIAGFGVIGGSMRWERRVRLA